MSALNLKNIDEALAARSRELARTLTGRSQIAIETSADGVDNSLLAAAREYSAQALSRDMRLLREVEAARKRLRNGVYGICLRCEEEIAPKRLQVIPWAAYCISCQAAMEEQGQAVAPARMRAA
jgi:DnaK suppressor protein